MMLALVTHETRRRPFACAYSNANRMIRSEPSGLIGFTEMPDEGRICFACMPFSVSITRAASGVPDSYSIPAYRSSVFSRTITTSTFVVARAHAGVGLARPDAREEAELVAQRDVHRAEPGADRRRDRALERDTGAPDRGERLVGQRRARGLHHLDPCLLHVPREVDPGRLEDAARGLGELGPGAVAGYQCHLVRHGAEDRCPTDTGRSGTVPRQPTARVERNGDDERVQSRARRGRGGRDRDRRARPRRGPAPLSRHRHRGSRRSLPVRERLGPAGRRRPRVDDARPGAVRAGEAHRERARRSAGRDGAAGGRVEAREAQRDLGRAGARRPRPALRPDDDDRRALGARRRRQDRTPSPTRSSHAVRPRPRSSSCAGAARPIRGT